MRIREPEGRKGKSQEAGGCEMFTPPNWSVEGGGKEENWLEIKGGEKGRGGQGKGCMSNVSKVCVMSRRGVGGTKMCADGDPK